MTCCPAAELPKEFKQIPDSKLIDSNQHDVVDLTQQISDLRKIYSYLPQTYQAHSSVRVVFIALFVVALTVGMLALTGNLTSFPEKFLHFIQNANWSHITTGVVLFAMLAGGAALIIHRAIYQKDRLTQTDIGKMRGDEHWVSAVYTADDGYYHKGYIDTSTLDKEGTGTAFMYAYKDEGNNNSVNLAVFLFSPLHMIGAIVYNLLRLVVIPFYILGCLLVERAKNTVVHPEDRAFRLSDIPKEWGNSILRVVKAPFYCLALMFVAIYAFFDHLNGRKLGSYIERDWNEGLTRAEGFWSVQFAQSLWRYEGGGAPNYLGRNGFYLAGCWQPIAVVYYEKGKIVKACSLSRAVNPEKGKAYTILTSELLIQKHNALVEQLEKK